MMFSGQKHIQRSLWQLFIRIFLFLDASYLREKQTPTFHVTSMKTLPVLDTWRNYFFSTLKNEKRTYLNIAISRITELALR